MAPRRKNPRGWRILRVDGESLLWRAGFRRWQQATLDVVVRRAIPDESGRLVGQGATLVVETRLRRTPGAPPGVLAFTPAHVVSIVREAKRLGWDDRRPRFHVALATHRFLERQEIALEALHR